MHKRKIYLFIRIHDHPLSKLSVCYPFRCGQFYLLLFLFQGNKTKKELHKCVFFLFFTPGKIQITERKLRYSKSFCCWFGFFVKVNLCLFISFNAIFWYTNRCFIFLRIFYYLLTALANNREKISDGNKMVSLD